MARRKQRGSRETGPLKEKGPLKDKGPAQNRQPRVNAVRQANQPLPPAHPPRRNVPLLVFSITLFALWVVVLLILANFR